MVIDDAAGAAFLADLNLALPALASLQSGASAPSTAYAYQLWADTTAGLLKQRNAANSGWIVRGALAESFVLSRSSNTILAGADLGKAIIATAAFTQTLTAAATLGDGWFCDYNAQGYSIVLDPNGSEQIDGATTKTVTGSGRIYCNGSAFFTIGFPASSLDINSLTEDTAPDFTADFVPTHDASAAANKKVKLSNLPSVKMGTVVATTSGTTVNLTDVPSGVKAVDITFNVVSTNGSSGVMLQIGPSGGVVTTGYSSTAYGSTDGATSTSTAGLLISRNPASNDALYGNAHLRLMNASTNTWTIDGMVGGRNGSGMCWFSGIIALAGPLIKLRLATVNGSDTFDAGDANTQWQS